MPPTRKTPKVSTAPKPEASIELIEVDKPAPDTLPSKPEYVVNFSDSDSDRSLLTQIEETLAQHQAIDFSDLCKEALQQLLAPDGISSEDQASNQESNQASLSQLLPLITQLQQQVATLEAQITQSPNSKRIEHLESLVISLEQRIASFEVKAEAETGDRSSPQTNLQAKPAIKQASPDLDPLLSRLSNLLEDF